MNTKWEKYYNELEEFWVVDENDNSKKEQLDKIKELYKSFDHDEQLLDFHKMLFPKAKVGLTFDGTATIRKEDRIAMLEIDEEKTMRNKLNHHLIIGDNLLGLQNLQLTHTKKIDVIYIDPPYNTGGTNLGYRDQFGANAWLNFMNERLLIAKELLSDDGVIFVSIDDNMMAELKLLMNDIFGKDNFQSNLVYISNLSGRQISSKMFAQTKEYILVYSLSELNPSQLDEEYAITNFEKIYSKRDITWFNDELGPYYFTHELHNSNSKYNINTRKNLFYPIYVSNDGSKIDTQYFSNSIEIYPPKSKSGIQLVWRWEKNKVINESYDLHFTNGKLYTKRRETSFTSKDLILSSKVNTNKGNNELNTLKLKNLFESPKNTNLIKYIQKLFKNKDITILDFFAGSGTTAQAVMELNAEDGGTRQFIGIQIDEIKKQIDSNDKRWVANNQFKVFKYSDLSLDEIETINDNTHKVPTFENGEKIISIDQITLERIRRVITQIDLNGNYLDGFIKEIKKKCRENEIEFNDYIDSLNSNGLIVHKIIEKDISIKSKDYEIVNDLLNGKNIESYTELNNEIKSINLNKIYKVIK